MFSERYSTHRLICEMAVQVHFFKTIFEVAKITLVEILGTSLIEVLVSLWTILSTLKTSAF